MIVVVEGCRGTGKTSLANVISARTGAVVLRAFRPTMDHHHNGTTDIEVELKALGVPANTYVEDVYIADILGTIVRARPDVDVILDRSVGSAVAHGTCPPDVRRLVRLWQESLRRAGDVRYVWLRAPHAIAASRVAGRAMPSPEEYARLEAGFAMVYDMFNGPKTRIVTADIDLDAVADAVLNWTVGDDWDWG